MVKKRGKGWTRAGQYRSRENANKRAKWLRPKFNHVIVQKGTHSYGGGLGVSPKKQTVYRVWVK